MTTTSTVDLWVDPVCPFAWMTSRWLVDVTEIRPVEARFHLMSLSVLNEGREDVSDFYRDLGKRAWGPARVLMAAELTYGADVNRPLYEAIANRIHDERRVANTGLLHDALLAAGLDTELAGAAECVEFDGAIRTSHHRGIDAVGDDVGTPVLHVHTPDRTAAFFGPIVSPAPRGDLAGRLWDGLLSMAAVAEFFELKRTRPTDHTER